MRDLLALVKYAYGLVGADPCYPPSGTSLIEALVGPRGIKVAQPGDLAAGCPAKLRQALQPRRDALLPDSGRWEIVIRRRLLGYERDGHLCHEGAELLARQIHYRLSDREVFCNELGWALQAPNEAIDRLFGECGFDLATIGDELGLSDLAVAVRIAQARSFPTMMATPHGFTTLGESVWQTDDTLAIHRGMFSGVLPDHIKMVELVSVPDHYALFALPGG